MFPTFLHSHTALCMKSSLFWWFLKCFWANPELILPALHQHCVLQTCPKAHLWVPAPAQCPRTSPVPELPQRQPTLGQHQWKTYAPVFGGHPDIGQWRGVWRKVGRRYSRAGGDWRGQEHDSEEAWQEKSNPGVMSSLGQGWFLLRTNNSRLDSGLGRTSSHQMMDWEHKWCVCKYEHTLSCFSREERKLQVSPLEAEITSKYREHYLTGFLVVLYYSDSPVSMGTPWICDLLL